jgi:toxin-antitoxin system PIN domain toxin
MPVFLLDVNVLLALAWPNHLHHEAAHRWFVAVRTGRWATCPHTEIGFVRLSMQPAVVKTTISFADAFQALTASAASPQHEFWPHDSSVAAIGTEMRTRIAGHHQLADAMLLDLAIRQSGKLATFDRRIASLLAAGSPNQAAIELIAA